MFTFFLSKVFCLAAGKYFSNWGHHLEKFFVSTYCHSIQTYLFRFTDPLAFVRFASVLLELQVDRKKHHPALYWNVWLFFSHFLGIFALSLCFHDFYCGCARIRPFWKSVLILVSGWLNFAVAWAVLRGRLLVDLCHAESCCFVRPVA